MCLLILTLFACSQIPEDSNIYLSGKIDSEAGNQPTFVAIVKNDTMRQMEDFTSDALVELIEIDLMNKSFSIELSEKGLVAGDEISVFAFMDSDYRDGIPSPGGINWDAAIVRDILRDERYAGTMVYNRTIQKLKTSSRANPKEKWIRTPESFERIIELGVFARAQEAFAERARFYTPAYMLEKLEAVFDSHGVVRSSLVRAAPDMPSPATYLKHFGSMDAAFQQLFDEVRTKAGVQVSERIEALVNQVLVHEDFLVIDDKLTVLVQPSVPMPYGLAAYWFFRPDQREVIDITLGVPLSEGAQPRILGYLALPRLLVHNRWIRLFSTSHSRLEMCGHNGLAIIEQLVS